MIVAYHNLHLIVEYSVMSTHVRSPIMMYRNDPKFSDRYAGANSADSDQTAPKGAF